MPVSVCSVYSVQADDRIAQGAIGLNAIQRRVRAAALYTALLHPTPASFPAAGGLLLRATFPCPTAHATLAQAPALCQRASCNLCLVLQNVRVSSGDRVMVTQFLPPPSSFQVALLNAEVGFVSTKAAGRGPDMEIDAQVGSPASKPSGSLALCASVNRNAGRTVSAALLACSNVLCRTCRATWRLGFRGRCSPPGRS